MGSYQSFWTASSAHQIYPSWHPEGDDVLSKEIHFKNGGGLPVNLNPRRDFSTPFKARFGLLLDVYEQEDSLDLYTSWDGGLRSQSDIEQLMADFVHRLDELVGRRPMAWYRATMGILGTQ